MKGFSLKTASKLAAGLLITAAAALSFLTVFGCGGSDGGSAVTITDGGTVEVRMKNTAFTPADLTVDKGTTIKWTNEDSVTHTVTANDNKFSSGNLSQGGAFQYTFNDVGTYEYKCTIHVAMKGKITVR